MLRVKRVGCHATHSHRRKRDKVALNRTMPRMIDIDGGRSIGGVEW